MPGVLVLGGGVLNRPRPRPLRLGPPGSAQPEQPDAGDGKPLPVERKRQLAINEGTQVLKVDYLLSGFSEVGDEFAVPGFPIC